MCKVKGSASYALASKIKEAKLCIKNRLIGRKKNSLTVKDLEIKLAEIEKLASKGGSKRVTNFFVEHYKNVDWVKPKIEGMDLKKLTMVDSKSLEDMFSREEVWEALSSYDGNKAPGSDEMNLNFIKSNWKVIQEDFMRFMLEFRRDGSIVKDINHTFIALIPKCSRPKTIKDYRPISLVGSIVAWWFKHFGKGSSEPPTSYLLNLKECCCKVKKAKKSKLKDWIPHDLNTLKFNVDGSARGSPGPAGMGGVLRDSNGKVLFLFSSYVGNQDAGTAEIMAIHRPCDLCYNNEHLILL
ncbi:hypothetical protein Dsin_020925 [Dipteronia sinensis]|uniref:RNase H type-1 domain-containing protein n=1 Tax=Dipteronia sinensis TaxID=43782 RepID=A0AAE0E5F0_9ROSI|nr:hypothetical protein Dsin_020925 [Dipteronia sinensis]